MDYKDKYDKYYRKYQQLHHQQMGGSICMNWANNKLQFTVACPPGNCKWPASEYIKHEVDAANLLFDGYLVWASDILKRDQNISSTNSPINTESLVDKYLKGKGKAWKLLHIREVTNPVHAVNCNHNTPTNLTLLWRNYDAVIDSVNEIYQHHSEKKAKQIINKIINSLRKAFELRNRPRSSEGSKHYGKELNTVANNVLDYVNSYN